MLPSGIQLARIEGMEAAGKMSGADLIVYLQMIMLDDYDSQLADLAKQLENNIKIKAKYREQIDKIQKFMASTGSYAPDVTGFAATEWLDVRSEGFKATNEKVIYSDNGEGIQEIKSGSFGLSLAHASISDDPTGNTGHVLASDINGIIDHYKGLIDGVDSKGELLQLKLQQIMQKRSMTLETITNIMKKDSEAQLAIVRNIA